MSQLKGVPNTHRIQECSLTSGDFITSMNSMELGHYSSAYTSVNGNSHPPAPVIFHSPRSTYTSVNLNLKSFLTHDVATT